MRPGVWLNDEMINYYIHGMLLQRDKRLSNLIPNRKKSHAFNSFFMDKLVKDSRRYKYDNVKSWSKLFDAFELDKIFIPINIGNSHWVLGVIFIQKKEVRYYDSMHGDGKLYRDAMMRWVVDEAKAKKGIAINEAEWKSIAVETTPQQFNGTDCGVFTIMAADFLSDDLPVNEQTYGQANMPYFRQKIVNDMYRGKLDYPMIVV